MPPASNFSSTLWSPIWQFLTWVLYACVRVWSWGAGPSLLGTTLGQGQLPFCVNPCPALMRGLTSCYACNHWLLSFRIMPGEQQKETWFPHPQILNSESIPCTHSIPADCFSRQRSWPDPPLHPPAALCSLQFCRRMHGSSCFSGLSCCCQLILIPHLIKPVPSLTGTCHHMWLVH